jgi:hypothetical protein
MGDQQRIAGKQIFALPCQARGTDVRLGRLLPARIIQLRAAAIGQLEQPMQQGHLRAAFHALLRVNGKHRHKENAAAPIWRCRWMAVAQKLRTAA